MKHIKKKYAFCDKTLPIKKDASILTVDRRDTCSLEGVEKSEQIAFIKDVDGNHILSLIYKDQGKNLTVPIPDLTLVYYDSAYMNNVQRKSFKKDLFEKLSQTSDITDDVSHEVYRYINYAATSVIMLFTAVESFMNSIIPDDGEYAKKQKNRTEIYNKEQIERHINFEEKLLTVLPYFKEEKKVYKNTGDFRISQLGKLKTLRDEIIHTKSSLMHQKQSQLIEHLLNFEFDQALIEVKEYINFYKPNYIEDCPCNDNF